MSTGKNDPVLIIGGSGVVGSQAARMLRRFHPDLRLAIGGRDLAKAEAVARDVGGAGAVQLDVGRAGLGLAKDARYRAVVTFLKDDTLNSLKYAQANELPYLSLSSFMSEIGPEVARYVHNPASAPILMASSWLAGSATLPALHFAKAFRTLEAIEIAAVLDEQDLGGPAAVADFERLTKASPHALMLKDGRWLWAVGADASRTLKDVDGHEVTAQAYSPLDVLSLASATEARSVRFDLVYGQSASRRRGERFSTEIVIELTGEQVDGTRARVRHDLVHPEGQAPLTALGVTIGIERLLGLADGEPVAPGLYLPEVLIDPAFMMRRLEEIGTQIRSAPA